MSDTNLYLVVEPISVIAEDLALCIGDADPRAHVVVAPCAKDAVARLGAAESVRLAIIHADPQGFAASALGQALAARGARVVFMGERAESSASPSHVLYRPFSSESVADLVAQVAGMAPDALSGA